MVALHVLAGRTGFAGVIKIKAGLFQEPAFAYNNQQSENQIL